MSFFFGRDELIDRNLSLTLGENLLAWEPWKRMSPQVILFVCNT